MARQHVARARRRLAGHPLTRRITGYPQYTTGVVERLATAEGFKVRDSAVLDTYKGEARVIAIAIETPA